MSNPKTLLISEIFPPQTGGSGRWFWELYRRLPREQFQVIAGDYAGSTQFDETHELNLVRMPLAMKDWGLLHPCGALGYLRRFRMLQRYVRDHGVQMVHVGRCLPEGWLAWLLWRLHGIPYAVYVHGEDAKGAGSSREFAWMVRRVFQAARFLIANSQNTRRILESEWKISTDRIHILYPGVDVNRFRPVSVDASFRTSMKWADRKVILTVARLERQKGHDTVIRALPGIITNVPEALYVICGDGSERASLERLAAEEGVSEHVQFLGDVSDDILVQCYQQCDLFVLANRQIGPTIEGFGMVLLEAQACGKPVIAGDSGGTAETMRVAETGWIVPCTQPEPLTKTVVQLLNNDNLRRQMGSAAKRWVNDRFDWNRLAADAMELFESTFSFLS